MAERKRQMHFGVFVLGTGNHSAGWRMESSFASSCSLPVMKNIAQTAERGKFDLFFISDGVSMDPGACPAGLMAEVGLRWWRHKATMNTERRISMSKPAKKQPIAASTMRAPASAPSQTNASHTKGTAAAVSKQSRVIAMLQSPAGTRLQQ